MSVNSGFKIYGVLGYPVKHSLSPAMHNAAFKHLGINAEYRLFEIAPDGFDHFLGSLAESGIRGLNVTVPYKEKVLKFVTLDQESLFIKQLKAVNTIVVKDGMLKGFNTDAPGFQKHLKENFDPAGKKAAILGAGGASRSVAYVLANSRVKQITIFDIAQDKAADIVSMVKDSFSGFPITAVGSIAELDIRESDILVNTTPVGLKDSDPCLVGPEMLHKNLFVYDLIYNPEETKLLKLAKAAGLRYSNGLGMLLYQGMLSFSHWTGLEAPGEIMAEKLKEGLGHGK